jgi:CRISPR-associated protein Csm3
MKKIAYHEITGVIHCLSGLRIGGSDELLQIGGTDLTCIKHPVTLKPYIPGSSIKGKMRSELEQRHGLMEGSLPLSCKKEITDRQGRKKKVSKTCGELKPLEYLVAALFGPHMNPNHEFGPTRIVVRDAQCITGGETELKSENAGNRETGTSANTWKVERVVAGSEFSLRIGIQVWDLDQTYAQHNSLTGADALVAFVKDGLRALQQTGLGSGVSKGSGEIEFRDLKLNGQTFTL